jgi:hypothetical protein
VGTSINSTLFRQAADLNRSYPGAESQLLKGGLRWIGTIQPAEVSESYRVMITWDGRASRPTVRVLQPKVRDLPDKKVPHVFSDMSLCLHLHDEWHPDTLISASVIPWTSEWLLYYELWLLTGEWFGGGHELGSKN